MSETQSFFNVAVTLIILLTGWWNKSIWDSIAEVKKALETYRIEHNNLQLRVVSDFVRQSDWREASVNLAQKLEKLENLEVVLATNYVTQAAFERNMASMRTQLDRIEHKLDNKVDK